MRRPRLRVEAGVGCEGDNETVGTIAAILHQAPPEDAPARAWIDQQRRQARRVLRDRWAARAARLVRDDRVERDEAARVIEAALK